MRFTRAIAGALGAALLAINTPAHTSAVRRSPFHHCFALIEPKRSWNDLSQSILPPTDSTRKHSASCVQPCD